jgi:hypothetical protein
MTSQARSFLATTQPTVPLLYDRGHHTAARAGAALAKGVT